MIDARVGNNDEGITVHLLGYHTLLATDVLRDDVTTTVAYTATDLADVMKDIIDKYNIVNADSPFTYDSTSIPTTGIDVTAITFQRATYKDAMDKIRSYAPAHTFFYIDETNKISFKDPSATATHTFTLGKHFSALNMSRGIEKLRNGLLLWNGETGAAGTPPCIYKFYEDSNSQAKYGRRTEVKNDYTIGGASGDEADADLFGKNFIDENKEPEIVITIQIMDNSEAVSGFGYDIESIQPGDTCAFVGFTEEFAARYLAPVMLITKVVYNMSNVELTIDARQRGLVDTQDATRKQVGDTQNIDVPASYTT